MKYLFALLVSLFALLAPAKAQVQVLHAEGPASYGAGNLIQFGPCNLPPSTPVRVDVLMHVHFWYSVNNIGPAVPGYQYGQGVNYTFHSIEGASTRQLCNNSCGGAIATGETKEMSLYFENIPSLPLDYVTTAAEVPFALELDAYGGMQDWGGFPCSTIAGVRKPFRTAQRHDAGVTLIVTPL